MNNSNSTPEVSPPRATLKLKAGPRKSPEIVKSAPPAAPPRKSNAKPGAHWSDEYKQQMQADMDRLISR
jgi:hypothetical protein